jgi:hypothetical protein
VSFRPKIGKKRELRIRPWVIMLASLSRYVAASDSPRGTFMDHQDVVLHEETAKAANPFGIQTEGPLQNQMTMSKRAPKYPGSTDATGFGSRTGGDG